MLNPELIQGGVEALGEVEKLKQNMMKKLLVYSNKPR